MQKYFKEMENGIKQFENKVDKFFDLYSNQSLSMAKSYYQLFKIMDDIWSSYNYQIRLNKFDFLVKYLESRKNFIFDSTKKNNYNNVMEEFKKYGEEITKTFYENEDRYINFNPLNFINNEHFRGFLNEYYTEINN